MKTSQDREPRAGTPPPGYGIQPMSGADAADALARQGPEGPPHMRVCLYRSGWVDLLTLSAADIDLEDIAHSLAHTNRWNGATRQPVSVAWHSLVVAALAAEHDWRDELHGLIHDVAEAYTGDWIQPFKAQLPRAFRDLESRIEHACFEAAGIRPRPKTYDAIRLADKAVLLLEHASPWGMNQPARPEDETLIDRARNAACRVNPDDDGAPFELAYKSEWAFMTQAFRLMPPEAPLRRRHHRYAR